MIEDESSKPVMELIASMRTRWVGSFVKAAEGAPRLDKTHCRPGARRGQSGADSGGTASANDDIRRSGDR
jgi:hypothetical protein